MGLVWRVGTNLDKSASVTILELQSMRGIRIQPIEALSCKERYFNKTASSVPITKGLKLLSYGTEARKGDLEMQIRDKTVINVFYSATHYP